MLGPTTLDLKGPAPTRCCSLHHSLHSLLMKGIPSSSSSSASSLAQQQRSASRSDEVGVYRLALVAVLGLGCGFLVFNFQHILAISHIHLSLAHSHRSTAFCAFAKCRLDQQGEVEGAGTKASSSRAAGGGGGAGAARGGVLGWVEAPIPPETIKAMSTRVCGSPAVDGYAHVDAKCLETSPTAAWWNAYYLRGGKQKDLVAYIESEADYDGLAVVWGIGNKKKSAEECAKACMQHEPKKIKGPFENLPCNAFTWCSADICFEPDAHNHSLGDCWLKFTEGPAVPEINFRGRLPPEFRLRHPTAPNAVQWWGGVLLPAGVEVTNGTFGPRWKW